MAHQRTRGMVRREHGAMLTRRDDRHPETLQLA
jgi:hypothetical protein